MTYFTTALDLLDLPEGAAHTLRLGSDLWHRLTPATYAWVLQRFRKAQELAGAGRMPPDTLSEVRARLAQLQEHAEASGTFPFPDGATEAAMVTPQKLPPAAQEWSGEEVAAVARFWHDHPDAPDCLLVRAPDGTLLGCASSAELKEWEEARRKPFARTPCASEVIPEGVPVIPVPTRKEMNRKRS